MAAKVTLKRGNQKTVYRISRQPQGRLKRGAAGNGFSGGGP